MMKSIFDKTNVCKSLSTSLVWLLPVTGSFAVEWGRTLPTDRDDVPALTVGPVSDVQASVIKGGVSVPSDDLSIGESGWGLGYSHEYWGWLCSLRFELLLTSLSEQEIAQSDIYLKTSDKVEFNGASYRYMRLPTGTPFENQFTGGWLDLNAMVHPVMFGDETESLTPLIEAGFLGMGGTIGVDAGDPTSAAGEFVTGGSSSGFTTSLTPQLGGGLDWRIGAKEELNHILQLHVLVGMPGMTDADHLNVKGSYHVQFPLKDYANTLFTGLDFRYTSTTSEDDNEKSEFDMSSIMMVFGMTY